MAKTHAFIAAFVLLFYSLTYADSLASDNVWRLRRAAEIFASEIKKRGEPKEAKDSRCGSCHKGKVNGITVNVPEFSDIRGRPIGEADEVTEEFKRQLQSAGHFLIFSDDAEFEVKGVLLPFKGRQKWRLSLRLLRMGSPIASYEGILVRK